GRVAAQQRLGLRRIESAVMPINMFFRRTFEQPLSVADVVERVRSSEWCYDMHKVDWRGSFLATNGHTMLCWFIAADAESVRIALGKSGAETQTLWAGTVHEESEPRVPNVIVERSFQEPVTLPQLRSAHVSAVESLQAHRVKLSRTFFSLDGRRML